MGRGRQVSHLGALDHVLLPRQGRGQRTPWFLIAGMNKPCKDDYLYQYLQGCDRPQGSFCRLRCPLSS